MKIPGETNRPSPLRTPALDLAARGRRGVWIDLQDSASLELICAEGPDWICIDAGAQGIIFPTVEGGDAASKLVSACRFPPRGGRSYGPVRRSPRYAKPTPGVGTEDPFSILMVETQAGYENLDAILAAEPDGVSLAPTTSP